MTNDQTVNDRRLRILMIAPTSFFADYGCHVRILEEVRALTGRGHRVVVCTYHNGNDISDVIIRRSIDVPWRKRVIVGSSRHKLYLDAALSLTTLRTAYRFKPDIIHAHLHEGALIGAAVAKMFGRPIIFDYQGSLTEEMLDHGFVRRGGALIPLLRRLERVIDSLPRMIVTSSENARQRLLQTRPPKQIHTLLDAVDTERFSPDALTLGEKRELRRQLGIPDGSDVIVYLGLLAPYQGSDLLLHAARTIAEAKPNAFFLLMGFPGVEQYQQLAQQLGLDDRVSFPGRIPYADAHRYLGLGDVAVAPKMSLTEGNGKIYNYMSMGLPVVAFDAEPNREILGDLGIYARHGDAEDFASQVIALLDRPDRGKTLGNDLRSHTVAELSWETRVIELLDIYGKVLPQSAPLLPRRRAKSQRSSAQRSSTED
ncbi:MAG TPA: glycosyltransferase family 4 protein [Nitrolancea sp.]|nr:glycosyltransferase family 4 protein [Nitrolancea sp.]